MEEMKEKKRSRAGFSGALVLGWLCFIALGGCMFDAGELGETLQPSKGKGLLRVSLAQEGIRTLMPQTPVFSRYTLDFTCPTASPVSVTVAAPQVSNHPVELEPGVWELTVRGFTNLGDTERKAAYGVKPGISIVPGQNTPVAVPIAPITPGSSLAAAEASGVMGRLTYRIHLPAGTITAANIYCDPEGVGSSPSPNPSLIVNDMWTSVVLAPGYYGVGIVISIAGEPDSNAGMVVHIYPGLETKLDYDFR